MGCFALRGCLPRVPVPLRGDVRLRQPSEIATRHKLVRGTPGLKVKVARKDSFTSPSLIHKAQQVLSRERCVDHLRVVAQKCAVNHTGLRTDTIRDTLLRPVLETSLEIVRGNQNPNA